MIKRAIDYIQNLIDLHGDTWLAIFTSVVIVRIILVVYHHPGLSTAEAMAYGSCVAAFAATNTFGGPKT
jgi:hypothetical protein